MSWQLTLLLKNKPLEVRLTKLNVFTMKRRHPHKQQAGLTERKLQQLKWWSFLWKWRILKFLRCVSDMAAFYFSENYLVQMSITQKRKKRNLGSDFPFCAQIFCWKWFMNHRKKINAVKIYFWNVRNRSIMWPFCLFRPADPLGGT